MVTFHVRELAEKKGVTTYYQLMRRMDIAPSQAKQLWSSERNTRISADTIDAICETFNCTPNDFIVYVPNKQGNTRAAARNAGGQSSRK